MNTDAAHSRQGEALGARLRFAEHLSLALRLVGRNSSILFALGLGVFLPLSMLSELLSPKPGQVPDSRELVLLLAMLVPYSLAGPVLSCALTGVIARSLEGQPTRLGDAFRVVRERGLAALGTAFLSILILATGFLLLLIPGIYLTYAFLVVYQVVTLEELSGFDALQRSRELIRGQWWRGFGLMGVTGIALGTAAIAGALLWHVVPALKVVGEAFVQAASYAITTAVLVLFYYNLRARSIETLEVPDAAAAAETIEN